ncbi:MAG: hypothetical protein ACSHW0_05055 [Thalassotalea sp.]
MKHSKLKAQLIKAVITSFLFTTSYSYADCNDAPINPPSGDVSALQTALQNATNTGQSVRITGTFNISEDMKIWLRKDLIVDATGATFRATSNLDGDMFSIDSNAIKSEQCSSTGLADVKWIGGTFVMADAKMSTVIPYSHLSDQTRIGTKATADAISIRGTHNTSSGLYHKLDRVEISAITYYGTDEGNKHSTKAFWQAGGDSAILMGGALSANISDNEFYGVRDVAIYVSADNPTGIYGDHFTMDNNYIERAFDGIASKRGADNIKMRNNECNDVAICLSIKNLLSGRTATNVTIHDNKIIKGVRAISLERVNNASVQNNIIIRLGDKVANISNTVSGSQDLQKYSSAYEAISLMGVQYSTISNNDISASTTRTSSLTWGIVQRSHDGRNTSNINKSNNSYNSALDINTLND